MFASAALVPLVAPTNGAEPAAAYTVQTLHFKVSAGAAQPDCDIVGDLYLPKKASTRNRVPAILTTNGFGGSKDDQAEVGELFASRGYAVLSYSGLGFGGSDCKITLDDPDIDGVAGSQLISFLGGKPGIAFTDDAHTKPFAPLRVITRDKGAHDPRVGMMGGSYGGQIQFAIASVDRRLDTIVPAITWHDLSYSLGPNNAGPAPGAAKLTWALGFTAAGAADGLQNGQTDPDRLFGCPNFADFVCPTLVQSGVTGHLDEAGIAGLRHASVSSYVKKIRIPTLLLQGEADTLFNLNEALANYRALRAQGTPVKMIWHSWGHSGDPAPGDFDHDALDPRGQYETGRIVDWFDHHLKDERVSTGPRFAYFRDWVDYDGNARPAYATAERPSVGAPYRLHLGASTLTPEPGAAGSQSFVTPPAGAPAATNPLDAINYLTPVSLPEASAPGTFASWDTGALAEPLDVVGSPVLDLTVDAPVAAAAATGDPSTMLVLFARLQDVAPDGTASDIKLQIAPFRIADPTRPVRVTMPAIVHRFAAGHRLRLVVSSSSINYRGGLVSQPVTIAGGPTQALTLPVVS
ncbi:MAG: alpha/beta fold hydrolase [Nocardioides sp.]|uniref:alpha/beta fold hydrolase n=1 Tax=Nocardioides sp. TaxID=35761 RepID=UPI003265CF6B